ncbi:hypothetical protein AESSP_02720 [Aestuariimicrobium sp. T2.26MG-19.2B]|nr:hypothetical protein AESSP_02720 [Aestuariimicrobium sp. T2.26MG-19.2B]
MGKRNSVGGGKGRSPEQRRVEMEALHAQLADSVEALRAKGRQVRKGEWGSGSLGPAP